MNNSAQWGRVGENSLSFNIQTPKCSIQCKLHDWFNSLDGSVRLQLFFLLVESIGKRQTSLVFLVMMIHTPKKMLTITYGVLVV